MTSPNHQHHHHHRHQLTPPHHHQLSRLRQFGSDMTSSSSMDMARWFSDNEYRCQLAQRQGNNSYPPFFHHPQQQRRPDGVVSAGHSWPSAVDGAAAAPWSLHGGTPTWTVEAGTGRSGYRGQEAWPVVDNTASPTATHHQQYPESPDDVTTSLQMYKYPWMSIIGEFIKASTLMLALVYSLLP